MLLPPFDGPRFKAAWSKAHIKQLELVLHDFAAQACFSQRLIHENETNQLWGWVLSKPLPAEIPLLIGDAVHNARSALDILFCDIARMRARPTKDVNFPIRENINKFHKF